MDALVNKYNLYTKESLFEDFQKEIENIENHIERGEKKHHDYIYQLKVIQTILGLNVPTLLIDRNNDNAKEVRKSIENLVEGNESLYGYTFYVSSNYTFDYSWSYMRKQMSEYIDFLFNTNRFFVFVLRDINALMSILSCRHDIHVVFNEMIDVKFSDIAPYAKANMLWEQFHNIIKVGIDYRLSVKLKEATLVVYNCSYKDDVKQLCDMIQKVLSKKY